MQFDPALTRSARGDGLQDLLDATCTGVVGFGLPNLPRELLALGVGKRREPVGEAGAAQRLLQLGGNLDLARPVVEDQGDGYGVAGLEPSRLAVRLRQRDEGAPAHSADGALVAVAA